MLIAVATSIRTNQNPKEGSGAPRRLSLLGFMSQQDWRQIYIKITLMAIAILQQFLGLHSCRYLYQDKPKPKRGWQRSALPSSFGFCNIAPPSFTRSVAILFWVL